MPYDIGDDYQPVEQPEPPSPLLAAVLRGLGMAFVVVAIGGGGVATFYYRSALSDTCDELPEPELEIEELIALKEKMDIYKSDPHPQAVLELSIEELNFGVRGHDDPVSSHISAIGERVIARVTVPTDDGQCYNVRYAGRVAVDDGRILLEPEFLQVGSVDLTRWLGTEPHILEARDLPSDHRRELVGNVHRLRFVEGGVNVELRDRYALW